MKLRCRIGLHWWLWEYLGECEIEFGCALNDDPIIMQKMVMEKRRNRCGYCGKIGNYSLTNKEKP